MTRLIAAVVSRMERLLALSLLAVLRKTACHRLVLACACKAWLELRSSARVARLKLAAHEARLVLAAGTAILALSGSLRVGVQIAVVALLVSAIVSQVERLCGLRRKGCLVRIGGRSERTVRSGRRDIRALARHLRIRTLVAVVTRLVPHVGSRMERLLRLRLVTGIRAARLILSCRVPEALAGLTLALALVLTVNRRHKACRLEFLHALVLACLRAASKLGLLIAIIHKGLVLHVSSS